MSIFFTIFAPYQAQQVLDYIPTNLVEEVKAVERSPSQHGRIKGTISRAEVIGARDKRGRLIIYKRPQCCFNSIPGVLIGELTQVSLYTKLFIR